MVPEQKARQPEAPAPWRQGAHFHHLRPGADEWLPEAVDQPQAAHAVVGDVHGHSGVASRHESVPEVRPHRVVTHAVHLEQDLATRGVDRVDHGREGLAPVAKVAQQVVPDLPHAARP